MRRRGLVASLVGIVAVAVIGVVATLLAGWGPVLGLDLQGGASVVLQPTGEVKEGTLDTAIDVIRNRVDGLGVAEPEITRNGDAIVVSLPGVNDQDRALDLVGQTAELRFRYVLQDLGPASAAAAGPTDTVPGETTVPGGTTVPGETTVPGATTIPGATETTAVPGTETTLAPGAPDSTAVPAAAPETTAVPAGSVTPSPGDALPVPAQTPDTSVPVETTGPGATETTGPGATETTVPAATPTESAPTESAPTAGTPVLGADGLTPPDQDQPDAMVVLADKNGNRLLLGPTFLKGDAVADAQARLDQAGVEWSVAVDLTDAAASQFDAAAAKCFSGATDCPPTGASNNGGAGGRIAIVLDHEVVSAPTVNTSTFNGKVSISGGDMGQREAKDLALVLRYGSLPVQLEPQAVQTVSATLGSDSLHAGIIAGLVGVSLVLAFMVFYYRYLGLVVLAGLCVSGALLWTVIAWLGERQGLALTLAGATGIIVSIGVTVDSYVVYFERLKDEIRAGRNLRSSAERGFKSAYRTIVAADLVSLIGAALLWYLTVGAVRGFAFFLGLSSVLDMIVAYFFTRPAVILLSRSAWFRTRDVLGVTPGEGLALAAGTR